MVSINAKHQCPVRHVHESWGGGLSPILPLHGIPFTAAFYFISLPFKYKRSYSFLIDIAVFYLPP